MTIPKIIVQTSRKKPDKYIVDMIRERSPGWDYMHFTDDEIIEKSREISLYITTGFIGIIFRY